jgi:hypothetical protein
MGTCRILTGLVERSLPRVSNPPLMQTTFHTLACMVSGTSSIGCGRQQTRRKRGPDWHDGLQRSPMFLSEKRQSFVALHILLSLKLTASIARATIFLVRKMGYDHTRSSSASAGSRKMRRRRIHRDNSTTMNSCRRKRRKTVLMFLYLPQGTKAAHSLLDG